MLADPVASVRIAAALELANIPAGELPEAQQNELRGALDALRDSMLAKADFPESQMAIGGLAMTTRNWEAAQAAFAEAVFLDPQLVQAWLTRARIVEALGNQREAAAILIAARTKNPTDLAIAGQLSQMLVQQGQFAEAVPVLRDVAAATPDDPDIRINLAYALLQTGDLPATAAEIDRLKATAPHRPEVAILQALWQVASGDLVAARDTVRTITQQNPGLQLPPPLDALSRLP